MNEERCKKCNKITPRRPQREHEATAWEKINQLVTLLTVSHNFLLRKVSPVNLRIPESVQG